MRIGITGAIASGKSTVARFLGERLHGAILSADEECRLLLQKGWPGWEKLIEVLGSTFLDKEGEIDRPLLRKTLFEDKEFRDRVNAILHPLARRAIEEKTNAFQKKQPAVIVIVEVPLLLEAGWKDDYDRTVVVYVPPATLMNRLRQRDHSSAAEARKMIATQMPLACKILQADHVIDNSFQRACTYLQLIHLAENILKVQARCNRI